MTQRLREGFTTGTAVAAATKAAVMLLCGRSCPDAVDVALPPFPPETTTARLTVALRKNIQGTPPEHSAWVIKDGGDDPDATHGMVLGAVASPAPFTGAGQAVPVTPPEGGQQVLLYAGIGVGTVTLPGLPIAVGEPAVNPQPRLQIALAAREAATECGYTGPLHVLILAPEGEERAKRTLNARLGIVGGISILGTQGIVRPYSHEAWQAAITQGLDVAAALKLPAILLSTGRRSERALFGLYPELPPPAGVQAADFAAFALRGAAVRAAHHSGRPWDIIWGCFPGKLLKLAQGLEYTHAHTAGTDIALLLRLCSECRVMEGTREEQAGLLAEAASLPTATGVLAHLGEYSPRLRDAVLEKLARKAFSVMDGWLRRALPDKKNSAAPNIPTLRLHVFDVNGGLALTLPGESHGNDNVLP